MDTKQQLLAYLEAHRGEYLSGETLAQQLHISRAAVWKAMGALKDAGYSILAVRNRGYCLGTDQDKLSLSGLAASLDEYGMSCQPEIQDCVTSTNALVRERAAEGAPEGLVILANQQTAGRGRLGRDFYSPPDTGLYLSLLLRPRQMQPQHATRITTMAALAACEAIEAVTQQQPQIKWVNDIFLESKKVCGILTEGSFNLETGQLDDVVVGVGFNVYPPAGGFPPEIAEIADSILQKQHSGAKSQLAAAFLNHFFQIYRMGEDADYASAYRARSMVIGKPIEVISPAGSRSALALDIDRDCRLIVRYEDGSIASLSSAEVSIRTEGMR